MAYASNKHCREVRLEAALFIGAMCSTSLLTVRSLATILRVLKVALG
jgi:hypothetical protein